MCNTQHTTARDNSSHNLDSKTHAATANDEIVRPENALVPYKPDVNQNPPQNVISEQPSSHNFNEIERITITISIPNDGEYGFWELSAMLFNTCDFVILLNL